MSKIMNAFKKSPVLNRHCLRSKIKKLSPLLLKQFNVMTSNKDTLFQATWSYYASGCQERLTSIRRRIEQNAKIVAPTRAPRTQLHKSFNYSLPPGVDLEDHIYNELVSCFRNSDEGSGKAKNLPKRSTVGKELNAVNYSTPEQWESWKREEQEVRQMLRRSNDPYRREELTSKLEKLRKLTNRHPLIILPCQPEEPASKKTKKRLSMKHLVKPEVIPKPGPYYTRLSEAKIESAVEEILRKPTKTKDLLSQASNEVVINLKVKRLRKKSISKSSKKIKSSKMPQVQNQRHKLKNHDPPIRTLFFKKHLRKPKSSTLILKPKTSKLVNKAHVKSKVKKERKKKLNPDDMENPDELQLTELSSQRLLQSSSSDALLVKPDPNRKSMFVPSREVVTLKKTDSWQMASPAKSNTSYDAITDGKPALRVSYQASRRSSLTGNQRMVPIRKMHFSDSKMPTETYTPFKANRDITRVSPKSSSGSRRVSPKSSSWSRRKGSHVSKFQTYIPFKTNRDRTNPITRVSPKSSAGSRQVSQKSSAGIRRKRSIGKSVSLNLKVSPKIYIPIKPPTQNSYIGDKNQVSRRVSRRSSTRSRRKEFIWIPFKANVPKIKPAHRKSYIKDKTQVGRRSSSRSRRKSSIRKLDSWLLPRPAAEEDNTDSKPATRRSSSGNRQVSRKSSLWNLQVSQRSSSGSRQVSRKSSSGNRQFGRKSPTRIPTLKASAEQLNLISEQDQETSTTHKNKFRFDWTLPVGLKHSEYFKPFGQFQNKWEVANQTENQVQIQSEVDVMKPLPPCIPVDDSNSEYSKLNENSNSLWSYARTTPSSRISTEVISVLPTINIANLIKECLKSYESEMSFNDNFTNFMKPNKLDYFYPETNTKQTQVEMDSKDNGRTIKEIKPKKKKKISRKVVQKPEKHEFPSCSMCNMVRRRQSELRPYMKEMQRQRQRMELKTYYTQNILKKRKCPEPDPQESGRACTRQDLKKCYKFLKLCQEYIEQRQHKTSQECQS